ncbi:MAG TPA: exodeoxyribonuclease V subunit gamma, partial [Solirubrobacteraceae bacterium]|nr:exodeoxyribonuclease V subunit gamma [Solirubrobacteraceae bacterium]
RLTSQAVAAATGIEADHDPWLPERSVWPLLELADPKALGIEPHRRFAAVRHIADLFDAYALHRPEMLRGWAKNHDSGWQADLWRRLNAAIPVDGPAERVEAACARLTTQPDVVDLPPRLSLFGLTRLPAGRLAILRALAEHRDVHLFLLHPSPALWEHCRGRGPVARRKDDPTTGLPDNPLLASWGHDSRELQLVLGGDAADHHHPVDHRSDSLLSRIQADVRENRAPPRSDDPGRPPLASDDRSVEVHSCHGRARQVEVLHDAILHLLADDPTLEPRDVIVMCPDIETFAPLIQATFGAGAEERPGAPDLRVRLADRSIRQTNPVLGVVARLLELADERLTASQVLDLADREPVRRRFGLDDDALARAEEWVRESGVRWGLDEAHRAPFKLELRNGTWRFGLDRLLLGVTMTEDEQRLFGGVLPLDDVESGAIELAGRVAELLDRLHAAVDELSRPQPVQDWAAALARAADALTETDEHDTWQRAELGRLLDDVVSEAAGNDTELALGEVRALLGDRLRGRPTRANFRTGHLTVCTLVPMRSVPHRVVCLLGLDDGAFPRKSPRDGDDLMLEDPHVGERDARTEDRQLLLDALMAATDRLIVTYTGNDERTNLPRPPAVPVGELLDIVVRTVDTTRERIVVRHPLQPFDPRNFTPGELVPGRVWSFDAVTLEGARALDGDRTQAGPFLREALPPLDGPVIELADLVRFVQHPVRAFLRKRLHVRLGDFSDELSDRLAVELAPLDESKVGRRLLEARLAGIELQAARRAEIARGTLPPGYLGVPVVGRVQPVVERLVALVPAGEAESLDVRIALADGSVLSGTVPEIVGDTLRNVAYSRVAPRHRLAAWVHLLALAAGHPDRRFDAVTIGRARDPSCEITVARIAALDAAVARDYLDALVDLYHRGMREPAPLASRTSAAYAAAAHRGEDPAAPARSQWEGAFNRPGEAADEEHVLVLGGELAFDDLLLARARPDEQGPRWDRDEPRRFGRWARRLWDDLLANETVEDS